MTDHISRNNSKYYRVLLQENKIQVAYISLMDKCMSQAGVDLRGSLCI